jgi:hypothetical protein
LACAVDPLYLQGAVVRIASGSLHFEQDLTAFVTESNMNDTLTQIIAIISGISISWEACQSCGRFHLGRKGRTEDQKGAGEDTEGRRNPAAPSRKCRSSRVGHFSDCRRRRTLWGGDQQFHRRTRRRRFCRWAFQSALSHFAAGIKILLLRPFEVGQRIAVDGVAGIIDTVPATH